MTISKNPQKIREMFDLIANKYDFNNNLISLGLHNYIKRLSVKELDIPHGSRVLDECCGTGDIAKYILQLQPDVEITGVDFSENMLKIARKKVKGVNFLTTDCTKLPFENESFDIATMGFGLRNIEDYGDAIAETYRVLKKGGQFLQLDFGRKNLFSRIFDMIVPVMIRLFYGKNLPYKYLLESKKEFPTPNELIKIFETYGFKLKSRKDYLLGIISVQIMEK